MNSSVDEILQSLRGGEGLAYEKALYALLVAFIVGQVNAWFYKWTHRGVSYSRTFTQALILITIISSLSMMLIMSVPIAAFGLLGGLSIIRFRTVVRDARDNVYVLLCLICGMSAGMGHFLIACLGSVGANSIAWYLDRTGFGGWRSMESVLRFQIEAGAFDESWMRTVLSRFCRRHSLVSVGEGPSMEDGNISIYQCVYKVRLRNPESAPELISTLRTSKPVRFVNLLVDAEHEEIA